MGEAKRRKLAGYVAPEPKAAVKSQQHPKVGIVGIGSMTMIAAMLANYPKLPNRF